MSDLILSNYKNLLYEVYRVPGEASYGAQHQTPEGAWVLAGGYFDTPSDAIASIKREIDFMVETDGIEEVLEEVIARLEEEDRSATQILSTIYAIVGSRDGWAVVQPLQRYREVCHSLFDPLREVLEQLEAEHKPELIAAALYLVMGKREAWAIATRPLEEIYDRVWHRWAKAINA